MDDLSHFAAHSATGAEADAARMSWRYCKAAEDAIAFDDFRAAEFAVTEAIRVISELDNAKPGPG